MCSRGGWPLGFLNQRFFKGPKNLGPKTSKSPMDPGDRSERKDHVVKRASFNVGGMRACEGRAVVVVVVVVVVVRKEGRKEERCKMCKSETKKDIL